MLRKLISIGLMVTILGVSAVTDANEVIAFDSVYELERLVEEAQVDLTESSAEKALIESDYAQKRIDALEIMAEKNTFQYAERIMGDLERHEQNIAMWVSKARISGEAEGLLKQVEALSMERYRRLVGLVGDERLPKEARAGIEKALLNQEKAMEKIGITEQPKANEDNGQRSDQSKQRGGK